MIYLILCISLSCMVSTTFRFAEGRGHDGDNIMFINYLVSAVISMTTAVIGGSLTDLAYIGSADLSALFTSQSVGNSLALLIPIGAFSGIYYMSSLAIMRRSYFLNGMGITLMFTKACFIIPTAMALILWGEFPQGFQLVGTIMAIAALVIVFSGSASEGSSISSVPLLLIAMGICGMMQVNNKLFTTYCLSDRHRGIFLSVLYISATIVAFFLVLYDCKKQHKRFHITGVEMLYGLLAGFFNYTGNFLQLKSLQYLPAGLVFPAMAAGSLVIGTLTGRFLFGERMNIRQKAALTVTVAGLVLANL